MPGLIICGVILLILIFLLLLKVTLTVSYAGEVELWVRILFVKIRLVPSRDKKYPHSMSAGKAARLKKKRIRKLRKKLEKKRLKEEEKENARNELGKEQKEKKTPQEILDVISLVCTLVTKVVGKFFKHLRVRLARINMKIATDDTAATAITYGAVTQSINVLFPLLDSVKQVKTPKSKDINIYADFCSDETEIDIRIDFALRVWHVLHVAVVALIQFIKYYFKSAKHKDEKEELEEKIAERQEKAASAKKGQKTKRS
jgi:biopolymer transport protein ExbB/TolQ